MAEEKYIFNFEDYRDLPEMEPDDKYIVVCQGDKFYSWPRFGLPKVAPQPGDKFCFCDAETANDEAYLRESLQTKSWAWSMMVNSSYIGENGRLVVRVR